MRFVYFMIWCLFGFCLFLSGCRASLSAANLEASVAIQALGVQAPEIPEVRYDKDSE